MNSYASHADSDFLQGCLTTKTQPPGLCALRRQAVSMARLEWRGRPRFKDQPQLTMDCVPALKGLVRHSITRGAEHFLFLPPASSRSIIQHEGDCQNGPPCVLPAMPGYDLN